MSDDFEVFRIAAPDVLLRPSIFAFVRKALATNKLILEPERAMAELAMGIQSPELALLLGHEGKAWKCMALLQNSHTAFNPACVVVHLYNEGSAKLRRLLVSQIVEFAEAGSFKRIIGVDTNDSAKAFGKLFEAAGTPEMIGQMFIFNREGGVL